MGREEGREGGGEQETTGYPRSYEDDALAYIDTPFTLHLSPPYPFHLTVPVKQLCVSLFTYPRSRLGGRGSLMMLLLLLLLLLLVLLAWLLWLALILVLVKHRPCACV